MWRDFACTGINTHMHTHTQMCIHRHTHTPPSPHTLKKSQKLNMYPVSWEISNTQRKATLLIQTPRLCSHKNILFLLYSCSINYLKVSRPTWVYNFHLSPTTTTETLYPLWYLQLSPHFKTIGAFSWYSCSQDPFCKGLLISCLLCPT